MRRITLWLLTTIAALVLLFSYRTSTVGVGGQATASGGTAPRPAATGGPSGDGGTGTGGSTSSGSGSADDGSDAAPGSGSYDGSVAQTRWGPVQVRITVADGRITDVTTVMYPNANGRDQEINAYALPILHDEALQVQNANIDTVSGATVTSDGYSESLQAAIDAAHL